MLFGRNNFPLSDKIERHKRQESHLLIGQFTIYSALCAVRLLQIENEKKSEKLATIEIKYRNIVRINS